MIAILSPAMNMQPLNRGGIRASSPRFQEQADALAAKLVVFSPFELESLLRCNPQIACRSFLYYQEYAEGKDRLPALFAFDGLAYKNLSPGDFTGDDLAFAQGHMAILSALYGLLRPLDAIAPYRLDFMSRFRPDGKNLYAYWGDRVCRALYQEENLAINLASGEYEKLIRPHLQPGQRLVDCLFLVLRSGKYRNLATEAKMARGQMMRYIIKNRTNRLEDLWDFDWNGYAFSPIQSDEGKLVFLKER